MESRKIVLIKLFAGKEWRCRHRERTFGPGGEEKSGTNRESSIDRYMLLHAKQIAGEKLLNTTGNPPSTL